MEDVAVIGAGGLSASEASARLERFGPNKLDETRRPGLARAFVQRVRNPLVLILTAAAAISAVTGDVSGLIIIGIIVLASITLDVLQEYRAGDAAAKLRARVSLMARAIRDGRELRCSAESLVPGIRFCWRPATSCRRTGR